MTCQSSCITLTCDCCRFRPTKELLHAVTHAAAAKSDTLDARQLSMMAISWARLNFRPDGETARKLIMRLFDVFEARFGPAPMPQPPTKPVTSTPDLASVPRSDASQCPASDITMHKFAKGPSKVLPPPEVSKQAVANLCWALHHLGLYRMDKRIAPVLTHAARAVMGQFNLVELSTVGKAIGGMAVPVSEGM